MRRGEEKGKGWKLPARFDKEKTSVPKPAFGGEKHENPWKTIETSASNYGHRKKLQEQKQENPWKTIETSASCGFFWASDIVFAQVKECTMTIALPRGEALQEWKQDWPRALKQYTQEIFFFFF